jgi:hypothetical protein
MFNAAKWCPFTELQRAAGLHDIGEWVWALGNLLSVPPTFWPTEGVIFRLTAHFRECIMQSLRLGLPSGIYLPSGFPTKALNSLCSLPGALHALPVHPHYAPCSKKTSKDILATGWGGLYGGEMLTIPHWAIGSNMAAGKTSLTRRPRSTPHKHYSYF